MEKITYDHLAALQRKLQAFEPARKEFLALYRDDLRPEHLQKVPEDFGWAPLYELDRRLYSTLLYVALGIAGEIADLLKGAVQPNLALLGYMERLESDDALIEEKADWIGRGEGPFTLWETQCITVSMLHNAEAMKAHGLFINDLLVRGAAGDDASLLKAIQIDPSVVGCQAVVRRISWAGLAGKDRFVQSVSTSLSRRRQKRSGVRKGRAAPWNDLLRIMLMLFEDAAQLNELTMSEADRLFIQELKVYSDQGADPARSLYKFIDRFKKR